MPRLFIAVVVGVLCTCMGAATCNGQNVSGPSKKSASGNDEGLFPAGESIPLARSLRRGQLGSRQGYACIPLGTADVFGNGAYDLFLAPDRLFPFEGFDDEGVPYYGKPVVTKGENIDDVITGPGGVIYGIKIAGRKVFVSEFDKQRRAFVQRAASDNLSLPAGLGGGAAGSINKSGNLQVYATIAGQSEYLPAGDHHGADFMPYDGAGFWRGKIPRRVLYHIRFDSPALKSAEAAYRVGQGPGEFLFSVNALTIINVGDERPPALVTSEKLGVMRYYVLDASTGTLGPQQFVNNEDHVALRHHVINTSAKAIPDRDTGLSNLIVGDTGRIWFYRFSGELLFIKNIGEAGRPEFDNPVALPVGGRPLDIKAGYRGSIQGPGEAAWGYTCPTLYDWDGDGRLDVILNSILADYMFLKQLPGDDGPAFSEPRLMYCDGLQLHLAWRSQPAITDWGGGGGKDGRLCMVALDEQNLLRRFWRIDNQNVERGELLRLQDGSPITANADEAAGQTGRAKLVAHDWDADGDVDLLIGTSRGLSFPASKTAYLPSHYYPDHKASVLLLRNVGSNADPVFDYVKQLDFNRQRIGLGIHSCSPAPIDLGRGVIDLLVGEETGTVRYYPRESLTVSAVDD